MQVVMKNPKTGELKEVKVGWSWTLLFFSGFYGLPLFLRRLPIWGSVCLILMLLVMVFSYIAETRGEEIAAAIYVLSYFVLLGIIIFLAIKGNELTAKNYIEQGWVFVDPESETVKMAKGKWGISDTKN